MSTEQSTTDALRVALSGLDPAIQYAKPTMLGPLHQKVCAVVDDLKAQGMAPEHIILIIKGIASDANSSLARSRLVEQMVTWCVEQYFKEPDVA